MSKTTLTAKQQRQILKAALEAKTTEEADALEALIVSLVGEHRRPVGDMADNIGAINASSDARLALNERYTNGIDAVLEMRARLKYGDDLPTMAAELPSPREAAQKLLGVPNSGPGAMKPKDRQKLAELVELTLLESGVGDRPTAVCRDRGIGQAPAKLPDTILSLHRGNKRDKPFLMGVYGWGGSNALGFAERTVIVTRRHPELLDGDSDGIAVTVVRRLYEPSMRTPAYSYLVDEDGDVISLDPKVVGKDFDHGTHVAHIAYELTIKGALINQYNFFSAALFEPVMPVYLGSYRDADSHPGRRTIIGTGGRLKASAKDEESKAEGTKIAYSANFTIGLGPGRGLVRANVWVLDKEGAKPSAEIASGYVSADSAITVTLNGQRQETERREWIKRNCKYPHLFRRMVIQIEADEMTQEAKVEAFASTRERLRGPMHERIFTDLVALLKGDEKLEELERKLREEALKHTAERASDKDLEKLRKAIGKLGGRTREVEVEVEVPTGGGKSGGGGGGGRDLDDSALPLVPTFLEFDRHELTVEAGGPKKRVIVSIDAKNGYLPAHDGDLRIVVVGPAGETESVFPSARSGLLGGQAQWLIRADDGAAIGEYKLTAELDVGGSTIGDSMTISLVARREKAAGGAAKGALKKKAKQKREVPVGPQVNWVRKDEWDQHDFTASTVGKVDESASGVDIYLNLDFDKLAEVLGNPSYSTAVVEARKSSYMVPTALGMYRIHQMDQEDDLSDAVVDRMLRIVADSVLLATDPDGVLGVEDDEE